MEAQQEQVEGDGCQLAQAKPSTESKGDEDLLCGAATVGTTSEKEEETKTIDATEDGCAASPAVKPVDAQAPAASGAGLRTPRKRRAAHTAPPPPRRSARVAGISSSPPSAVGRRQSSRLKQAEASGKRGAVSLTEGRPKKKTKVSETALVEMFVDERGEASHDEDDNANTQASAGEDGASDAPKTKKRKRLPAAPCARPAQTKQPDGAPELSTNGSSRDITILPRNVHVVVPKEFHQSWASFYKHLDD
ncbi:TPA: hypothetical protein N0F65_010329 [Lagenidium giganteum]|uniref:Uncharacterized protein n=1 Tax=Lagenidium giganteum TaxID=4803 RepID=A0AAV2Z2T6_9STRA|nr:TPA: hypothetical protein N0F65_010329 [Lagenidium giganteum]